MNAKIEKLSEMEKVLSVKEATKHDGIDAVTLILSLCLFRINGCSIFSAYRNRFHGLLDTGKNCFYRMMLRPSMDWRRLLDRCCLSF